MLDYLIQNGTVYDGSGKEGFTADIAVKDGKIVGIGAFSAADAEKTVDAAGKAVTPGFIDIHRHADAAVFGKDFGKAELKQGLTTVINGNCGMSAAGCGEVFQKEIFDYLYSVIGKMPEHVDCRTVQSYLSELSRQDLPLHFGTLMGGGTLRASAAGFHDGALTAEEKRKIHKSMEQALQHGAMGISLGLGYAPECFYSPEELAEILAPLKNSGVVITTHMRQEGEGVVSALEEMLKLAKALQTPIEISHLKAIGKNHWHKTMPQMLSMIEDARQSGLDVSCDVYPYTRGSTQLVHILPPECQSGGLEALSKNLTEKSFRAHLRERMLTGTDFENLSLLVGFENICVTSAGLEKNKPFIGKSVSECAALCGKDPFDFAFDLLSEEQCGVTMIDAITHEDDIALAYSKPFTSVISDAIYPAAGNYHPRVYGAFSHMIERYVNHTAPQAAISAMTGRPAQRMGLKSKGFLRVGYDADVCVFAPERVSAHADYDAPRQYSSGMDYVFVGGRAAIADGEFADLSAGTVLRK